MKKTIDTVLISNCLAKIQNQFTGAKATVICRTPGDPDMDFLLGDDSLEGIQEVLDRSRQRQEVTIFGEPVPAPEIGRRRDAE